MMNKRIDVEILPTGEVKIEFSGFQGETCFDAGDELQRILKELGLWAVPVEVIRKSPSEISSEVGEETEERRKVPHLG